MRYDHAVKELAYMSRPQGLVFDDDVLSILQASRRNNARLGLTGLLCYDAASFFQILEGEDRAVDHVFDAIRRDPRHHEVKVLAEGEISERAFGSWSMSYRRIDTRLTRLGLVTPDGEAGCRTDGRVGRALAELFGI